MLMNSSDVPVNSSDVLKTLAVVLTALTCPLCLPLVIRVIEEEDNGEPH